jgi:hypothetical protein
MDFWLIVYLCFCLMSILSVLSSRHRHKKTMGSTIGFGLLLLGKLQNPRRTWPSSNGNGAFLLKYFSPD